MKLHEKYKPLITCGPEIRYYIITGGRGSGKSYGISTILTGLSFERGHNILYTRQTLTSAHLSIIPEYLSKIEELQLQQYFNITKQDIVNTLTGDKLIFRGLQASSGDNTANLKSLADISTWVNEESEELVDEATFDKIDLSIRKQGVHNRVILILNPTTKAHWIYKRFFEDKGIPDGFNGVKDNVCYIHTTYEDNIENLSKSFLDSVKLMQLRRPDKYKNQILGGWLEKAEGVIFKNWSIGKFNNTISSVYGQDFGFNTDPTVLTETAIDNNLKKIYVREHYRKQGMTTTDVYEFNKLILDAEQNPNALIVGDSSEPRLIHEVEQRGCNIEACKKWPGSVLAGINQMLDYEIIIDEGSTELIKEFNNYVWSNKKAGVPVDAYNHGIDAMRYSVQYILDNTNVGEYHIF